MGLLEEEEEILSELGRIVHDPRPLAVVKDSISLDEKEIKKLESVLEQLKKQYTDLSMALAYIERAISYSAKVGQYISKNTASAAFAQAKDALNRLFKIKEDIAAAIQLLR